MWQYIKGLRSEQKNFKERCFEKKSYHWTIQSRFRVERSENTFLERNKEPNKAKLNGLGGKLEIHESASQSMLRELKEEAGITAIKYRLAGLLRCSSTSPFLTT